MSTERNLAVETAARGMALAEERVERGWAILEAGPRLPEDDLVTAQIVRHFLDWCEHFARLVQAQKGGAA